MSKDNALNTMTAIQRRHELAQQIRSTILPGWQHMMEQLQRNRSLRSIARAIGRSPGLVCRCTSGFAEISPATYGKLFDLWQRECG